MNYPESIVSADRAKALAREINFGQTAVSYVLWDRTGAEPLPFYVGTAKSQSRIDNHARKALGNAKLARKSKHTEFAEYVETNAKKHGPEWIGFCLYQHSSMDEAKTHEVSLIEKYGLKKTGGKLFNRRMSG